MTAAPLMDLAGLEFPASPERIFGRGGPLVLEAGFGDGAFLARLARERPTWNVLGADVSSASFARAMRRMRRQRIGNVRLFRGRTEFLVRNVVERGGLHRLYVHFPDPWPKERHRDRRLLRAPFFRLLSTRLAPGSAVLFATDHATYFDAALEAARSEGLFRADEGAPSAAALETKYARKWRKRDIAIRHARLTPIARADDPFPPDVERLPTMHHVRLAGRLPLTESFETFVHRFRGGQVVFLDVMHAAARDSLVFAARIEEGDFVQDVLVEARRAPRGDAVVGVTPFGKPIPTRGTREAALAAGRWLCSRGMHSLDGRHPDALQP